MSGKKIKLTILVAIVSGFIALISLYQNSHNKKNFPDGERWIIHVKNDLMPFWMSKDALGEPAGNFPTFRNSDGSLIKQKKLPEEFTRAGKWLTDNIDKKYVRMNSRQIYAYCIGYHLTGDEMMLVAAKKGVDYLMKYALNKKTGAAVSYFKNGVPDLDPDQRTSQDLAYAQLGMTAYYYLTRDKKVLKSILKLKKYIFDNYYDTKHGMFKWVIKDSIENRSNQQELVAQLDQVNAYMLLLTPILPEPHRSKWKNDLSNIVDILINKFYNKEGKNFWGYIHDQSGKKFGARHSDFGHTIKAYWMIYLTGKYIGNDDYVNFSLQNIPIILNDAFYSDSSSKVSFWKSSYNEKGPGWWIYAELDQTAATLSLIDKSYKNYLLYTYDFWFNVMVDKKNHEVWPYIDENGNPGTPKIHLWKNGYHSLEHALVGYITTQEFNDKTVKLYYAFNKSENIDYKNVHPYYYRGKIISKKIDSFSSLKDNNKFTIIFDNIK